MTGDRVQILGKVAALCGVGLMVSCAPRDNGSIDSFDQPTVVSLNPCLDALAVEIANPDQLLALSHYSVDPSSSSMDTSLAARIGVTGGTAEEIIALDPDIVLASTFAAPSTINALRALGIQVEQFGSPSTIEQSKAQISRIGLLLGRIEAASELNARIADLEAAPSQSSISAMIWQPGQIVPGEAALVSQLLKEAGFISHSAQMGLGQADYVALEDVVANPPDVLLVAGDSAAQRHPMLKKLASTRVEALDPQLLYCAGPTINALRKRLADIRRSM